MVYVLKDGRKAPTVNEIVNNIIDFETGMMNIDNDTLSNFLQSLIDSRMIEGLQGSYGRAAERLIEEGLCSFIGGENSCYREVAE